MPSPEVFDFDALLAPIADDKPTGDDPRTNSSPSSLYYGVKDARSAARTAERQLMVDESANQPDWKPVRSKGEKLLASKAKDLEIAAYLIESLARLEGFAGLRDGFRLTRELVERYWDGLYPMPDEDGIATRVAPITGLNGDDAEGTLIAPINRIPLTEGGDLGPFAYHHYQQASTVGQIADSEAREKRIEQGAVSLEMFESAVKQTPASFFVGLVEDLEQCREEFARLSAALDERCGSSSPPSSSIRSALESCLETVKYVARDKLASAMASASSEEAAPSEDGAEESVSSAGGGGGGAAGGPLRSREDAFRLLLQVADFFRRCEPHSPVSYSLEQAVRWGRMTLPELLAELIGDDGARQAYFKQVGIQNASQ